MALHEANPMEPAGMIRRVRTGRAVRLLVRLLMLVAVVMAVPGPGRAAERAAERPPADIERSFTEARAALAAGQGARLLPLLSGPTLERLEAIHRSAQGGTAAGAAPPLGPTEKAASLLLQRSLPPARLRRLGTAELVQVAAAGRWLPARMVRRAELGRVTVTGDRAHGRLLVDGRAVPLGVEFLRENGAWHIDLPGSFRSADVLVRLSAALAGQSEDDYVRAMVARVKPSRR